MFAAITCIEITCFLSAIIFLRHTGQKVWIVARWFTFFMVANDILLAVFGKVYHRNNIWLVNIYTPINFFIISWLLFRLTPNGRKDIVLLSAGSLLFSICFIFEISNTGIFQYCRLSSLLSDVFIFIMCNRFFYMLVKEDTWVEIQNHAAFWLVTGVFLFNLCAIIADAFDTQLTGLYLFRGISLYAMLYFIFSLILYGCWTFAFICKYRERI